MINIENINSKDILELVSYQQHPNYTRIQILRGYNFFARCVDGRLQAWTFSDTPEKAKAGYDETVQFEVALGGTRV
uniref:Uncharacterized protein n=1 Tax=viral metagenome TaxID=1070528 RepID=A0A6M3JY40_9ZZZZ